MPKKEWKRKREIEHIEKKEDIYYIFCEGEQTEPNYFKGFKKLIEDNPIYKQMVKIEIEPCAAETMRVIGKAEEYVEEQKITKAQVWCVYDKDSFPSEDFNKVEERAQNFNRKNKSIHFHVAWSNECIEIWFLLHFANYTSNNHREMYKKFLDEKFEKIGIGKYHKNMNNIFEILLEYGKPSLAIRFAKRIISDNEGRTPTEIAPGTKVYELVEELAKYLPEEVKKLFLDNSVKSKYSC